MPTILIAAGGTGGHIFPAESLAAALKKQNVRIVRITDKRFDRYQIDHDPSEKMYRIPSASPSGNPIKRAKALLTLIKGLIIAIGVIWKERPNAIIGFGGYPSFPAVAAGIVLRVPTLIHEQNAILGRTNRLLAPFVSGIATAYPNVRYLPQKTHVTLTGNPVRENIQALQEKAYKIPAKKIHVLITGGSQGARFLSEVVPQAIVHLDQTLRDQLVVTQQCREEDIEQVRAIYAEHGIKAELASFFTNMPEHLKKAHLIIARAGASTIAECAIAGKPAIFIPLPSAMDDHQTANAEETTRAGASVTIAEKTCTRESLAKTLEKILLDPSLMQSMADKMRTLSRADATELLVRLTLSVIKEKSHF